MATAMKVWQEFFARVDEMDAEDSQRADFMALLHRSFAALGHPGVWAGFSDAPSGLQERFTGEWLSWALRDVEWLAVRS